MQKVFSTVEEAYQAGKNDRDEELQSLMSAGEPLTPVEMALRSYEVGYEAGVKATLKNDNADGK